MKKILLMGLVTLGLLGSGNLEAKDSKPKVEYKLNNYKVTLGDVVFKLEERRVRNKPSQDCQLYLGSIKLTDRNCDSVIEWIEDKEGNYNRNDGPQQRFDKVDKLMKKYRTKFKDIHEEWEKIRWSLDPLNKY